jgi:hypothetical protein
VSIDLIAIYFHSFIFNLNLNTYSDFDLFLNIFAIRFHYELI